MFIFPAFSVHIVHYTYFIMEKSIINRNVAFEIAVKCICTGVKHSKLDQ